MCDDWVDAFERKLTASPRRPDPGVTRAGVDMFRELPAPANTDVVLVTDLHGDNILAARREPWLVVDPKPYSGDPSYDVLQHMLNCKRLRTDPVGLARRMCELLALDEQRVLRCLFARCVLESLDQPDLVQVALLIDDVSPRGAAIR